MADGHQAVKVYQTSLTLHQQDDMVTFADGASLQLVQGLQGIVALLLPHLLEHLRQRLGGGRGVVHGPMGVFQRHAQQLAHAG